MGVRINEAAAAGTAAAQVPQAKAGEEAAATARLFPAGTAALYGKDKDGKRTALGLDHPVRLVNVSLSSVHVRTANPDIKNPKGNEEKVVDVLPFGHVELPALHARRALETQEKPGGDPKLVVAPEDGDCGGSMSFRAFNKAFRTCPYGNCKSCGDLPPRVKWSVWQIQHRISMLGTEPAIRRVIESIDSRPAVVMWGLEIISQRVLAKQRRLGLVGTVNPADVVF